jgi:hypothetical protein
MDAVLWGRACHKSTRRLLKHAGCRQSASHQWQWPRGSDLCSHKRTVYSASAVRLIRAAVREPGQRRGGGVKKRFELVRGEELSMVPFGGQRNDGLNT